MPASPDYYALLGVLRDASVEEIKRAYVTSAQRLHPDKNKAPGETEMFLDIQQAYETLSNPKRRAQYDLSLPKQEAPFSPVSVKISYSRPNLVRLNEPQLLYTMLEVGGRAQDKDVPAPPLNVCLVLDRSTSMKDAKMDLLKAASIEVMRNMRAEDIFSVVTFSDHAEVVIPASLQPNRSKLESVIRSIQPAGATEMYQGLEAGFGEVSRNLDPRRVNHVILLTDGHTYGDENACLDLAARAAQVGIGISCMGIGNDWNDTFLDEVAMRTGNTSRYIARPLDIQKILTEKFRELTRRVAEEVTLEFQPPPGVSLNYAFRMQPESGPVVIEKTMRLGPILRDTHLGVLFEFTVHPLALRGVDTAIILEGGLKVSMPSRPTPVPPLRIRFERGVGAEAGNEPPSGVILQALSKLTLYRMQERARAQIQVGEFEKATRSLKHLASHLLTQGQQGLAHTVMLEVENLQRSNGITQEGGKEIKYATRALMMK